MRRTSWSNKLGQQEHELQHDMAQVQGRAIRVLQGLITAVRDVDLSDSDTGQPAETTSRLPQVKVVDLTTGVLLTRDWIPLQQDPLVIAQLFGTVEKGMLVEVFVDASFGKPTLAKIVAAREFSPAIPLEDRDSDILEFHRLIQPGGI